MCGRRTLSTEEFARDVEGFGSDDNNLLAIEKLLCDGTGETTEQVSLAVNDNLEISPPSQFVSFQSMGWMRFNASSNNLRQVRTSTSCPESPAKFQR